MIAEAEDVEATEGIEEEVGCHAEVATEVRTEVRREVRQEATKEEDSIEDIKIEAITTKITTTTTMIPHKCHKTKYNNNNRILVSLPFK